MMLFKRKRPGTGISLLIPFRDDDGTRTPAFNWLVKYWTAALPGAQIVIGTDDHVPFSKTSAFNDARTRATGDVFVLIDADCYLDANVLLDCAASIRKGRLRGRRMWFGPYRKFYRLTD